MHRILAALRGSTHRLPDGLTPASASPSATDPEAVLLAGGFFAIAVLLTGALAGTHLLLIALT